MGAILLVVASSAYLYYRINRSEVTWTAAEDAGQPQLSKAVTGADDPRPRESEIGDFLKRKCARSPTPPCGFAARRARAEERRRSATKMDGLGQGRGR